MAMKKINKNADMETLDENGQIKEKICTLANGATLIYSNQTINKTTDAQIAFNCGAVYDPKGKEGLAHLLEHMLVGHGNWHRNKNKVFEEFRNSDARFNAHTGINRISVEVNCPSQNLEQICEIYADLISDPKFTEESLKEEFETISEEIRMLENRKGHPLFDEIIQPNVNIGGTQESIRNIKIEDLYDFTRRHFCAENLVITVVSDLPFETVKDIMERVVVSRIPSRPKNKNKFLNGKVEFNSNKFYDFYTPYARNCDIELISMKPETKEEFKKYSPLEHYILNGFTGRMYQALRMKKQLVYMTGFESFNEYGNTFRCFDVQTSKLKFAECTKKLVEIIKDLQTNGITKEEFECFKKTLPFRKDRELNYRYVQSNTLLSRFLEQEKVFIDMEKISPENLTYEEANEYIKNAYKDMRIAITYGGNYDDQKCLTFEQVEQQIKAVPKILTKPEDYLVLNLKDIGKIMVSDSVDEEYKDKVLDTFEAIFVEMEKLRYTQEELEAMQQQQKQVVQVGDLTPEMIMQLPLSSIQAILNSPQLTLKEIFEFKAKVEKTYMTATKIDVTKATVNADNKKQQTKESLGKEKIKKETQPQNNQTEDLAK